MNFVLEGRTLEQAARAPRLHTEGGMELSVEPAWPKAEVEYLKRLGYKFTDPVSCFLNAVQFTAATDGSTGIFGVEDDPRVCSLSGLKRNVRIRTP